MLSCLAVTTYSSREGWSVSSGTPSTMVASLTRGSSPVASGERVPVCATCAGDGFVVIVHSPASDGWREKQPCPDCARVPGGTGDPRE